MVDTQAVTLARYLLNEQAQHPETEPEFWTLIAQMAYVAKVIARETRRAALVGRLGLVGERNPTGDTQKKLDVFANEATLARSTGQDSSRRSFPKRRTSPRRRCPDQRHATSSVSIPSTDRPTPTRTAR